jgi:hypothetical protein
MGTDHKRPVTSREPCSVAPDDMPQQENPTQSLNADASPSLQESPAQQSKKTFELTRPLVILPVRPKPKQLVANGKPGTPDWSLSVGGATILFGFVIAFGTYVTLTQRDAVQNRLNKSINQQESRTATRHVPIPMTVPTQDDAQVSRSRIDTSPGRYVNEGAAMPDAPATSSAASAQGRSVASSTPSRPANISATPLPTNTKPPGKQAVANAAPLSGGQTTKSSVVEASAATHARDTSTASRDRRPSTKVAKALCNPPDTCDQVMAQAEPPRSRPAGTPPATKAPSTAVLREATTAGSTEPARPTAPASTQAHAQPEAARTVQSAADKGLFRQH